MFRSSVFRLGAFALCLLLTAVASVAAPTLVLPPSVTAEATGAPGAYATYTAYSNGIPIGNDQDGRDVTAACSPASGSLFPLGTTLVVCTARDTFGGTSTGTFQVHVVDTIAPAMTLPASISVEATSPAGAEVSYSASAFDLVDGEVGVACTPASGSTFAAGTTIVRCSATDAHGNTARDTFGVTVTGGGTGVLTLPDITTEAQGPDGAAVGFEGVGDAGDINITCTPPSGSTFALGSSTVNCSGGGLTGSFTVTVVDTTPPVLSLPGPLTADATMPAGAVATYSAAASDLVDGPVAVLCSPPSGSTFPVGTTTVNCSAADSRGNTGAGSFDVSVIDQEPPSIVSISVSPDTLWPPNRQMVSAAVAVTATDNVDLSPTCRIYLITSNEAVTSGFDWTITGQLTASLRAERTGGGSGRVYTVYVECLDDAANRSTGSVMVQVPHDRRRP